MSNEDSSQRSQVDSWCPQWLKLLDNPPAEQQSQPEDDVISGVARDCDAIRNCVNNRPIPYENSHYPWQQIVRDSAHQYQTNGLHSGHTRACSITPHTSSKEGGSECKSDHDSMERRYSLHPYGGRSPNGTSYNCNDISNAEYPKGGVQEYTPSWCDGNPKRSSSWGGHTPQEFSQPLHQSNDTLQRGHQHSHQFCTRTPYEASNMHKTDDKPRTFRSNYHSSCNTWANESSNREHRHIDPSSGGYTYVHSRNIKERIPGKPDQPKPKEANIQNIINPSDESEDNLVDRLRNMNINNNTKDPLILIGTHKSDSNSSNTTLPTTSFNQKPSLDFYSSLQSGKLKITKTNDIDALWKQFQYDNDVGPHGDSHLKDPLTFVGSACTMNWKKIYGVDTYLDFQPRQRMCKAGNIDVPLKEDTDNIDVSLKGDTISNEDFINSLFGDGDTDLNSHMKQAKQILNALCDTDEDGCDTEAIMNDVNDVITKLSTESQTEELNANIDKHILKLHTGGPGPRNEGDATVNTSDTSIVKESSNHNGLQRIKLAYDTSPRETQEVHDTNDVQDDSERLPQTSRWYTSMNLMEKSQRTTCTTIKEILLPKNLQSNEIGAGCSQISSVTLGLWNKRRHAAIKRLPRRDNNKLEDVIQNHISRKLSHENLLPYLHIERSGSYLFIAYEICDYNLANFVWHIGFKKDANKEETKLGVLEGMFSGLKYLHDNGIAHGRLKPENVLLDSSGKPRLNDFGIPQENLQFTACSKPQCFCCSVWTPTEFMSQQGRVSPRTDPIKSDIQVMGMLVHYVLTNGKHAFGDTREQVESNIKNGRPQLEKCGEVADELLVQMLSMLPNMRPTIAAALVHPLFWSNTYKHEFITDAACYIHGRGKSNRALLNRLDPWNNYASRAVVTRYARWQKGPMGKVVGSVNKATRKSKKYDKSIMGLLDFFRDLSHCKHGAVLEVLDRLEPDVSGYMMDALPDLTIDMFILIRKYAKGQPEFEKYPL